MFFGARAVTLIAVNSFSPARVRHGILAGTKALVERTLELQAPLQSKSSARALSVAPQPIDSLGLIGSLYSLIEMNWDRSTNTGADLWRWTVRRQMNARNPSPERALEKAIVEETSEWVNQIPAAVGLASACEGYPYDERHMNVDLARRCGPNWFELVELKAGPFPDTPLWGAFEILRYGLLYCFAREYRSRLHMPGAQVLMKAERIDLKVLATEDVYAGYDLGWLADSLDEALREFSRRKFGDGLTLQFRFEAFPRSFHWPEHKLQMRQMLAARSRYTFRSATAAPALVGAATVGYAAASTFCAPPGTPLYAVLPHHTGSA